MQNACIYMYIYFLIRYVPCIRQRNVAGLNCERNNGVLIFFFFFFNLLKPRSPFRPLAKGNNTPLRRLYSLVEKALKARVRGARSRIIRDNARNTLLIPYSFLLMLINGSNIAPAKSQRGEERRNCR